ncbi:Lipase 2 [Cladobotryum mycophilum]|uniref:Carboxylic ester hydrolase n=1 Tax=Cladobotryum mycophilum TaxID=491253 RepID=A0ABR0SP40_9HYPO
MRLYEALVLALAPLSLGRAVAQPVVDLGYSQYQGVASNGVNKFLGMRYAAPPVGNLRWQTPSAPPATSGTQDASKFGNSCMGTSSGISPQGQSEDCLFVNVFTPSGANANSKLPVWIFIQGGGFLSLASASLDGSQAVANSGSKVVVVTLNYRVGIFGFLASKEIQANGTANAGMFDQLAALKWVKQHIAQFGGDPNHVVLHGESAGAESASLHLVSFGGKIRLQFQYDALISNAGCRSNSNTLACLRSLDTTSLQRFNVPIAYPGRPNSPQWPYTPCVDGVFLQTTSYAAFQSGKFVKVPMFFGDVTDEGTTLGAPNANSAADVQTFFQNNYPRLSSSQLASITQQYPQNVAPPFNNHNSWFAAASLAYGDVLITCHGINFGKYFTSAGLPVWTYRFNVLTQNNINQGVGVPHGFDLGAIFGGGYENSDQTNVNRLQGYYISFVRSLNPNTYAFGGSTSWPQWNGKAGGQRLLINNNNTVVESVPQAQVSRCSFWEGMAKSLEM